MYRKYFMYILIYIDVCLVGKGIDMFLHRHMYTQTCVHKLLPQSESMGTSGISGTTRINVKRGGGGRKLLFQESPLKKMYFRSFLFQVCPFFPLFWHM